MNAISASRGIWQSTALPLDRPSTNGLNVPLTAEQKSEGDEALREAFRSFVGETLFGQTLKAMRKTLDKPAYFHGGRAEEIFTQQLDQVLAEKMARADGARYSDAMYDLFTMKRS